MESIRPLAPVGLLEGAPVRRALTSTSAQEPWLHATRRRLLGVGAATVLTGTALAACSGPGTAGGGKAGSSSTAQARPSGSSSGITLVFTPTSGAVPFNQTLIALFQEAVQPFLQANPGVHVRFVPGCCNAATLVQQNLAGDAPDVSAQYQTGIILAGHAALDISAYVRRDNVDLTVFGGNRLSVWRDRLGGLYALPLDTNAYGMILNLTVLEQRGVVVPSKNWTSQEAQRLFEQATYIDSTGRRVSGGAVMCYRDGAYLPESFYLRGYGASYADPSNPAICTLDTSGAIAAGHWALDPLISGVCQNVRSCFPQNLYAGKAVADGFGLCAMIEMAQQLNGFSWDFWPMPRFPEGTYTVIGPDGYVIASQTKYPEQAWALVKWLTTVPTWQQFQMKAMLLPPVLTSLWDYYEQVVAAVAPPLATKDLSVLRNLGGYVLDSNFKYGQDQTILIMQTVAHEIMAGKTSVDAGFQQIAAQINALEAAQAQEAAAATPKTA